MPLRLARLSRIPYGHGTREGKIVGRGRFTDFREEAAEWLLFGGLLASALPVAIRCDTILPYTLAACTYSLPMF